MSLPTPLTATLAITTNPYTWFGAPGISEMPGIRLLSGIDPTTFAGHAVDLTNVPVRALAGQGLWVGFGPRSGKLPSGSQEAVLTSTPSNVAERTDASTAATPSQVVCVRWPTTVERPRAPPVAAGATGAWGEP